MTPDRWQQIEEIFQSALDLASAERDKFVEMKCAGDTELKIEIEKLLSDFDSADDFIESPVWTDSRFLNSAAKNAIENSLEKQAPRKNGGYSLLGKRVGVYELKAEIGRGGMGAVYLAERADGEFRQKVAIKLIKRGMDTDFVLSRFRHERQILANLNHPNIVLLLDGGTTDDGLPYFVMDYVEGEPLHKYCERKNLNLRERIEIFRQVCEAVDYAHRKMIVHRDLKPSNILVNKYGVPKLLDFGIAKLLDPEQANDSWIPTETHMRLMTPEYASPEQVSGTSITPASDIYSLGVLLYELVAGKRPYKFPTRAPHEVARIICEADPVKPSVAAQEQETKIKDQPNDELDKIVLKTLRKNPSERYETAAALAEDLNLYLEDRPVKAQFYAPIKKPKAEVKESELSIAILPFKLFTRPETETTSGDEYLGIGLADSLVMRLSGVKRLIVRPTSSTLRFGDSADPFQAGRELGVNFILSGNIRRVGERIRVTAQLLKVTDKTTSWAENFNEKFTDVLEVEDSISEKVAVSLLPYLTGEERRQIEKRGTNSPQAYEAFLRGRFNWSLQSGAGFARAIEHYRHAVELDPEYALAYAAIAEYYIFLCIHCIIPFGEGAQVAKESAEKAIRLDPTLSEGYATLGFSFLSFDMDWKKAEEYFIRALELNPSSTSSLFWRCILYIQTKRFDEAFEQLKRLQEIAPDSFLGQHMKAWLLYHSRRYNESIAAHRQLLKIGPNYAWGLQSYSWTLRRVGEFDEAVLQAAKAVQLTGEDPFYMTALAAAYADAGDRDKAQEILKQLTKLSETRFVSEYMLALVYCALGDKNKAFENLEISLATRDGWINWIGVEPQLDILRDDPRYENLLRRTGNPLTKPEEINTPQPTTDSEKSIAVLPLKLFSTSSGESDENEYLGIGLADALVTRLSNVKKLMVRPTSSVLSFGDSSVNPFQAGRELNVDYVLDGNIRRSGDRIRVTIQLLNIADNSSRWAESFNEHFTDVLELEDTISEKVIKCLIPHLTGEEQQQLSKRWTNNAEAYEAYLRGRFYWSQFTPDGFMKAQKAFQLAIDLDSTYALAYVGLADFYIWANIYGLIPSHEAMLMAEKSAQRAVEMDDKLGEAYASLGLTAQNRFDWQKAEQFYQKALEFAPNYIHSHEWWGAMLVGHGKFEEGLKEVRIAERLDPLSLRTKAITSWTLYQARHHKEALECAREIIELDKNYPQGYSQMGNNLLQMGQVEAAIANHKKFNQMIPNSALAKYALCHSLVAGGRINEAETVLEEIKELSAKEHVKPYFLAMAYAALGKLDEAFAYFEQAFKEDEPWMLWFGTEPVLNPLRDDARYDDLMRRMKLPVRKQKEIKRPDESPKTDDPKSIAVLPLKMIGADEKDNEYLSIGLADAMITRLSKVNRLLVRPTSSILGFTNWNDPFVSGRELNVDYILSGTMRKAGDRIRISTQLVEIKTNATLWAETFNEQFTNVLDLEDLVAEKVGTILIPKLTGEEQKKLAKRSTDNPQAFEAYLRGRYHFNLFTSADFAKAKDYFEQAISLDSEYALAYIGLAEYYFALGTFGAVPPTECNAKAKEMARRALDLDDTIGEAYTMIGSTYFDDLDLEKAEKMILRSIELTPNYSLAHVWISVLYTFCGRYDEALQEAKKSAELNPLSGFEGQHYAWILYHTRHFDEAIAKARQVQKDLPNFSHGLGVLSWILRQTGQIEESIEHARRAVELSGGSPWQISNLAASYAKAGQTDKARELLQQLEDSSTSKYVTPFCLAIVYVHLGQHEEALNQLEKALQTSDTWFNWITTEPQLDVLRSNSRFNELLRKSNNPTAKTLIFKESRLNIAEEKSIAVLPLKMSGDFASKETGEEFLSVGLTDALIMHLSQLRSFSVRPTSSVMRFAGKDVDSIKAGQELNVRYVLEGNISRTDNQLRVNLRLLNVSDESIIWSEEFNHDSNDIFVLEDEISEHVAKSILPQISPDEQRKLAKRGTENAEAYELYLRGRHHWNTFTEEGFAKAIYFYNQAIAIAPDFAVVYAGIADYYNLLGLYSVLSFVESSTKAKEAAQKAISLDSELAEGYAALGFATLMHELDWAATEEYLKKAIELNPNYVTGRIWYSFFLALIEKFDESLEQAGYALKLDPLNSVVPHTRNLILYFSRRFDESVIETEQLIQKEPHYALAQLFLSSLLWLLGRTDEALKLAIRAVKISSRTTYTLPWLAAAYAANGQIDEAKQVLAEIESLSDNRHLSPCLLAIVYCNLKDYEKAFECLEKAWEVRDARLVWIGVDPQFDPLRSDARFQDLLRRTGNPIAR